MKRLLLATAMVVAMSGAAKADTMIVMGAGFMSCLQFNVLNRQSRGEAQEAFFYWAQGFMSGLNMGRVVAGQFPKNLASIDLDDQERFLLGYCAAHADKQYMDAVIELLGQFKDDDSSE